jgi:hypothetical protein
MPKAKSDGHVAMQAKYIEAREQGLYPAQAARYAGYKAPEKACMRLETTNLAVMESVAVIEKENRISTKMTRDKVMQGIMDAIEQGRQLADPQSQIRGWAEINRMCGYLEPEKREIIIRDMTVQQRARAIEGASTEELLARVNGRMIEDAEYEILDDAQEN